MKRAKWILAVLTALTLCVIGMTALAGGEDPQLSLRVVVNGTPVQVDSNSQYTGSYYYKIYIDNIPEGTEAIEVGFGDVADSAPSDPWFLSVSKLREDSGGLFTMCLPDNDEGATYSETLFVRLHDGQAWQKVAMVHDLTKTNGSAVTISNQSGPALNEDYTIAWTGETNADAYIVYWKMPNGDEPEFFIPGEGSSLRLFSLTNRYGDVNELTRYAGTYEVWIETYANNRIGTSAHKQWTVSLPSNQDPEIHLTGVGAVNGVITVPVYGEVKANVTADDSVIHNQIEEFHFVNGQWTEGINPWDLWQNGYVQMCWRPNSETPQDFTVYAYARIKGEDGQPDRLVRSNALTVRVTVDEAIMDDVTYIVDGETDGHPAAEPIDVPKDGALVLKVDNIGADYYGAEIDRMGIHLDHIAESQWVTPEPGSTTEVRLPVFECEVGQEYEVRVYALKIGAAVQYAERQVRVRVVERTTDAPIILEIAGNTNDEGVYQFDTDERIRIYSYYENLDGMLDEEFSWIQVRAYNDHKDYCFWDENGDGFYYWTDGMRIGNPGDYLIEAVVMTNDGYWDREPREVDETRVTARIHVDASAEEQLAAPTLTVSSFLSTAGETDVTLNVGTVNHAERYFYWIHPSDSGDDRMNGDLTAAGPVIIDTSLLGPGVYTAVVSAHARGYEENFTTCYFVVLGNGDADLSTDDYYFSTNARPAAAGAATDFIADVGEEIRFIGFMPGSDEINLGRKKDGWTETRGFGYCEAPGMSRQFCFDEGGTYTVYMGGVVNGAWTEYPVCTFNVSSYGTLGMPWVDMPMVVDAGKDVHITYHIDDDAESYSYWISFEDDGRNLGGERIDLADLLVNDKISDEDTFDLVIPADILEANRVYHVYLNINKPGWEQGHDERLLFVLGEPDPQAMTLTVKDREGQVPDAIAIGGRYPVTVNAPGAETLHIWWDESVSFIDLFGDHFEQEFCLDRKGDEDAPDCCTFYAIATYDRNWLKVSPTIEIPISNRATAAEATAPTLTLVNQGTISKGQFVKANVGKINDEGVYEYCAYITDEYGNWICANGRGDPGVIALPTNDLEPGKEYKLRAYARVLHKYRTDSPAITFQVSEPTANLFVADKDSVAVMEQLTVSIMAPGADRVRFNGGYDNWDEFDGDSWYSDSISWDMSEDNITIKAEAWFPGDDDWTPIGEGLPISITASGCLDQPEFNDLSESIEQGQDLDFSIEAVEGAEEYEVQLNRFDGRDELCFRFGSPNFHIPARQLYGGGYRVKVIAMAYDRNSGQNETSLYVKEIRPVIGINSVVSNTEDLDITVPLVAGGEDYHLMIYYVPNDNFEESILFEADRKASDAQEGILTFTVEAGKLRDNTTHWVDLNVEGHDFYAENAKAFLVRNGSVDSRITMTVNGQAGGVFADVKIHENFTVDVSAQGAKAIIIHCGDMWQAYAGSTVSTGFNEYQICSEILYAQAYYGDETNLPDRPSDSRWLDLEWGQPGNPVTVNFYAIGQVGEPWGRFPNIVHKGEILVISDIYPGENGNEAHANINRNDPGREEDRVFRDWKGWDEASRSIYLPTDGLEANRDYWIMLDNSGIGMEGNRMWWRVSVFPGDELPAGSVAINTLEKVQTGVEVPVSVSAPGAVEAGFGLDMTDTEKADVTNYQFHGDENADSYFTRDDWLHIDDPGEHTLTAYAVFPDSNEVVYADKTITVCEPLRFDMTAMPGFFTEGQDDATVTVKLPSNAQRMSIQVYVEDGNDWQTVYESHDRDEEADKTIQIPAQQLIAGSRVVVDFQARADGFVDVGERVTIPVTAGTQSSLVTLRLVDNREDQTAMSLDNIWANQRMVFLATPTGENEITAIRFFNGHDWWEDGDAITRDSHEDWFMNDGSVFFEESYNDDDNRTITAFAEVLVNGGATWQRTNEIRFTVQNHGTVGEYDFVSHSDIIVPRGTVVTVEFEEADGATHYWIDAFDKDRGWDPWHRSNGTTVWFNTNRLPAGTYELCGRAGGSDESGLMWRESTGYVKLIITDDIRQMSEATFTTPRGLMTIEDEAFAGIAARVIVITRDVESVGENAFGGTPVQQVCFLNADTEIHWNAFGDRDNLTVYGIPGGNVESWAEDNFYTFYPLPMQE